MDSDDVTCLTNPYKAIEPGIIKIKSETDSDEIQILASGCGGSAGSTGSSNLVSPISNGPSPSSLVNTLSTVLNARKGPTPPEPTAGEFEELRMLRSLLQRATDKNRALKLQKEKMMLKRKILAVERENHVLKDEIGGLEKSTPSNLAGQAPRPQHPGVRVPTAQHPIRVTNSYNVQRQQVSKVAQSGPLQQQPQSQLLRASHASPAQIAQSALARHHPQQVSRYQNPALHRLPNSWSNSQNRLYQQRVAPSTTTSQAYYSQHQAAVHQQHKQVQHQVQQVAQQQYMQSRLQHIARHPASRTIPEQLSRRHRPDSNQSKTHSAIVNKIVNSNAVLQLQQQQQQQQQQNQQNGAGLSRSGAHNVLVNNHTGLQAAQINQTGLQVAQSSHAATQGAHSNHAALQSSQNNHAALQAAQRHRQHGVQDNQVGDFIRSALQKGGYDNLLRQMQMIARSQGIPTSSSQTASTTTTHADMPQVSDPSLQHPQVSDPHLQHPHVSDPSLHQLMEVAHPYTSEHSTHLGHMQPGLELASGVGGDASTIHISLGNEDTDVDIGIPVQNGTSGFPAPYTDPAVAPSSFPELSGSGELSFSDIFSMDEDDGSVVTSSEAAMTSADSGLLSSGHGLSVQQYDLTKLDNTTLRQLLSSVCSFCSGDVTTNKHGVPEELLTCYDCSLSGHPSCLQFSDELTAKVKTYSWQCIECKTCVLCGELGDDSKLMFCDECDKGFHTDCLNPPLTEVPEGNWSCDFCKGICVPQDANIPKNNSNSRDILLQKANKVINQVSSEKTPAEMMAKTEEIIASLLSQSRKRAISSEEPDPAAKRHLQEL